MDSCPRVSVVSMRLRRRESADEDWSQLTMAGSDCVRWAAERQEDEAWEDKAWEDTAWGSAPGVLAVVASAT